MKKVVFSLLLEFWPIGEVALEELSFWLYVYCVLWIDSTGEDI
jgi:hypothetical protein